MTRIRATCPLCGEVDLKPEEIQLEIVRDATGEVGDGSNYRFPCPTCREVVTKPADERVARLLATGGVEIAVTRTAVDADELSELLDDEVRTLHPELPDPGPPFQADDLLDFHQLLATDGWFEQLLSLVR